jgi:hypothetical protein
LGRLGYNKGEWTFHGFRSIVDEGKDRIIEEKDKTTGTMQAKSMQEKLGKKIAAMDLTNQQPRLACFSLWNCTPHWLYRDVS